jgi:CDP-glucose 4,6-dehydratase
VRDYIYVEDAASAYMTLARALAVDTSLRGQAFNFSNETPTTVLALVERVLALMKSPLRPEVLGQAPNEIHEQYLDASRARTVLGWKAEFGLDGGLEKTIGWYRDFFG